jgi:hypothetical protein
MWWVVRLCSWWKVEVEVASTDDGYVGDTRRSDIYRYRGMVGGGMKTVEY